MSWAAASDFAHPTMPRELAASDPANLRSQTEHIQHGGTALFVELRRGEQLGPRCRARPRCDREVLLAVDLEGHRGRSEAGAYIDLPKLVERGVIKSRDGAIHHCDEHETAGRREGAGVIRVGQL